MAAIQVSRTLQTGIRRSRRTSEAVINSTKLRYCSVYEYGKQNEDHIFEISETNIYYR